LKIRTFFLSLLLLLIIISAHPIGILTPIHKEIYPYLNALGIDISMTPITFDMMMMRDAEEKLNIYAHDIRLVYQTKTEEKIIAINELSFYRFRIPFILFVEWYRYGVYTEGHIYGICHELKRAYGPGKAWMVQVDIEDENQVKPYGFNMFHECVS